MTAVVAGRESPVLPRWKRVLDLAAVALGLPLLVAVGAAVYLGTRGGSPGPLLFRQERIGLRGRPFALLKFRTMHATASAAPHRDHVVDLIRRGAPMEKLDAGADGRLFRGAWLLRTSGLDELPQLVNVLRGEMSLVGPRPCLPFEFEQLTPDERGRCAVPPGLTGLWQVSGKNGTSFRAMVDLDLRYVRELSLRQDLRIIARTFPTLARQLAAGLRRRLGPTSSRRPATALPPTLPAS